MAAPDQDIFLIDFFDHERFAQRAGIQAPGTCEGEADVSAYIDGLLEVTSAYPLSITDAQTHINYPDEVRTSFGFDICDVRASATPSPMLGFGPSNVAFYLTSVEKDAIAAAVATDAEWSSQATATTIGSAELYDWGDRPAAARSSLARPLGIGGQLAVLDAGIVTRTRSSTDMDRVLDRDVDRLIDVPHVRAEMTKLTNAGAFALNLSNWMIPASAVDGRFSQAGIEPLVLWDLLVEGRRIDEDGNVTQMVFLHGSAEDARLNAARMQRNYENGTDLLTEQPFTEQFVLAGIDVDGTRVVVTIRSELGTVTDPAERSYASKAMFLTEG